jgi:hypothetical protein
MNDPERRLDIDLGLSILNGLQMVAGRTERAGAAGWNSEYNDILMIAREWSRQITC